jgi:hypothetical protein
MEETAGSALSNLKIQVSCKSNAKHYRCCNCLYFDLYLVENYALPVILSLPVPPPKRIGQRR